MTAAVSLSIQIGFVCGLQEEVHVQPVLQAHTRTQSQTTVCAPAVRARLIQIQPLPRIRARAVFV